MNAARPRREFRDVAGEEGKEKEKSTMIKESRFPNKCALPLCPKTTRIATVSTMKLNPAMNTM